MSHIFCSLDFYDVTFAICSDIVLTSHLKPLDKEDKSNGKLKNNWNVLANPSSDSSYYKEDAHFRGSMQVSSHCKTVSKISDMRFVSMQREQRIHEFCNTMHLTQINYVCSILLSDTGIP